MYVCILQRFAQKCRTRDSLLLWNHRLAQGAWLASLCVYDLIICDCMHVCICGIVKCVRTYLYSLHACLLTWNVSGLLNARIPICILVRVYFNMSMYVHVTGVSSRSLFLGWYADYCIQDMNLTVRKWIGFFVHEKPCASMLQRSIPCSGTKCRSVCQDDKMQVSLSG